MKTNRLLALILTLALAFSLCLTSCEDEKSKDLAKLNELSQKLEGDFTVSISVKSESGNVSSKEYRVTEENGKTSVYAKIETLNKFDVSTNGITAPDSYSTVSEGYLSDEEIAKGDFKIPSFHFSSENITNIAIANATLVGKVRSLNKLMGKTFDASDVKLNVKYSSEAIYEITVSFASSQNNIVTLTYTF